MARCIQRYIPSQSTRESTKGGGTRPSGKLGIKKKATQPVLCELWDQYFLPENAKSPTNQLVESTLKAAVSVLNQLKIPDCAKLGLDAVIDFFEQNDGTATKEDFLSIVAKHPSLGGKKVTAYAQVVQMIMLNKLAGFDFELSLYKRSSSKAGKIQLEIQNKFRNFPGLIDAWEGDWPQYTT